MHEGRLPELETLQAVLESASRHGEVRIECTASPRGRELPVYSIAMGSRDPAAPAVGFFGGVHGLERIGSRVVIAWLHSLVARSRWDPTVATLLERTRIVFMPLVNPGGMLAGTRSNPHGVDLMRNAPLDAQEPVPPLVGGHRLGPLLPWYRGRAGTPMEAEAAALCAVVERELLPRPFSIAVDCHSGFGMRDRLWFPYATRRGIPPHIAQLHALHEILVQTLAQHPYVVEPQNRQYVTHGDLWDHLYLQSCAAPGRVFLPLTLEMGSWIWVKKNPRQLFSRRGIFNPLILHREQRVLRRHLPLLDFVTRAAAGWRDWHPAEPHDVERHRRRGIALWHAPP